MSVKFKQLHTELAKKGIDIQQLTLAELHRFVCKLQEQMMAPRGSTFDKMAARTSGASAGPVANSPMARAAKQSAFEKAKAGWAAEKQAKAAALPPDLAARKQARTAASEQELPAAVKGQRRPVPRPAEEQSPLQQGRYPDVGKASRSPLT